MVDDDDDTERGQRRISAQDRLMIESARRKSYVYPVVEVVPMSEDADRPRDTKPWDLIDREELTPREQEIIRRSKRSSSDPATVADLVKVTVRAVKAEDKERSAAAAIEEQTLKVIGQHNAEMSALRTDVRDLKHDASTAKWIVRGLLGGSLAVFLYVADRILTRVEHEGETTIEMQHLKTTVEELRQDQRSLRSFLIKGYQP